MKAIGIDIGTTSICGVLINTSNGKLIKKCELPNDTWIQSKNEWEKIQNPDKIYEKVLSIADELYDISVISIGFTGQMHGIVYLDSDGNAVSPLYTWQDGRGNCKYNDTTYAKSLNSHTGYGYVTHTYNKINNLIPDNASVFCTIHDYAAMKLAGAKKPLVHTSDAASFGQFDIKTGKFTVSDSFLPDVTNDFSKLGEYKQAPVYVAIGDNQASFIGSGGDSKTLLINVGTGSQVSISSDNPVECEGIEVRPYTGDNCLMVGCSLCGGKSYALLERFFSDTYTMLTGEKCDSIYDKMNDAANSIPNTSLKTDNRFMGTRENPEIRGSITNISVENFNPENMVRSMIDAMADELYDMFAKMNCKYSNVIASGNGIRKNPALKAALEKKFNCEIKIPSFKEEASYGAALFSTVGCGMYLNITYAQKIINYGG